MGMGMGIMYETVPGPGNIDQGQQGQAVGGQGVPVPPARQGASRQLRQGRFFSGEDPGMAPQQLVPNLGEVPRAKNGLVVGVGFHQAVGVQMFQPKFRRKLA
jgi:hypothetical protein